MGMIRKLKKVLNKKQKRFVGVLIVLIIIEGLLETLGVSMILPIMTVVTDSKSFETNKLIVALSNFLGIRSQRTFVVTLLFGMAGIFVVKNLYMLWVNYVKNKFITDSQYETSGNLLNIYLHKDYPFFLNESTSNILRTVYSDTGSVFSLLLNAIGILTELAVCLFLGVTIFLVDWKMTLVIVGVLAFAMMITNLALHRLLNGVGTNSRKYQALMYKSILQSMENIKDVKVFAKENSFLREYIGNGKIYYQYMLKNAVFGGIPKLVVETACIAGVMTFLGVMVLNGTDLANMMPQLSAFCIAAVRLMPCASRVSNHLASIAYYRPALDYVYENMNLAELKQVSLKEMEKQIIAVEAENPIQFREHIQMRNMVFAYPGTQKRILNHVNLTVNRGRSVGIVGPSGAGKTTLVDILLGLLPLEEGDIRCDGMDVKDNMRSWLGNIGYIPQTIGLMDDTIRANIAFGYPKDQVEEARVWEVLEEAQLREFVEGLPEGLDTVIGERGVRISGGQRQRIGIARALFHNPELLILDEATSALDNDTEAAIMEAINHFHGKKTMLIIAHRLQTIEACDEVYRVEDGNVTRER